VLQFGTVARGGVMSEVVLVVDDDPVQRRLLEAMVGRFGYRAKVAEGGDAALNILKGPDATRIDAIVLDLVMPDLDGLGVLAQMREIGLNMPVIVQTAQGGIDGVASAMRLGAADFVVKPANAERVQVSLRNVLATRALAGEVERLRLSLPSESMCTQPLIEPSPALAASWPEPDNHAVPVAPHSVPLVDPRGRDAIRFALSYYRGQMSEVARRLKIGRSTLYRKLEGLGVEDAGSSYCVRDPTGSHNGPDFCIAKFPSEDPEMPLFWPNSPGSLGPDGRGIGANITLTDPDNTHGVAAMAARGDVTASWDGDHETILSLLPRRASVRSL
jgi:CheY-like chemotaxis protein